MSKFTPGPWHACNCGKCFQVGFSDGPICQVEHGEWGDTFPAIRLKKDGNRIYGMEAEAYIEMHAYGKIPEETAKANATLIAAAPELYEACKAALSELRCFHTLNPENVNTSKIIAEITAALAKADGKGEQGEYE
jgi:hypothetical protein